MQVAPNCICKHLSAVINDTHCDAEMVENMGAQPQALGKSIYVNDLCGEVADRGGFEPPTP